MPNLLRIDSSMDLHASRTRALTSAFARAWQERGADFTVVERDLHRHPLPYLSALELHWAADQRVDADVPRDLERVQQDVIGELLSADVVVIGAPKYNYAMPATLKTWIDLIHVPGTTAGEGSRPLAGRTAVIMTAQGVDDDEADPSEHVTQPLELILRDALGMTTHLLRTSGTLAGRLPGLDPARAQREFDAALRGAHVLAATIGAR